MLNKALIVAAAALLALEACSDPFSGCEASRTCAPAAAGKSSGGEAGQAEGGSGGDSGAAAGAGASGSAGLSGGSAGAEAGGENGAVGGDGGAPVAAAKSCDEEGRLACLGTAQKDIVLCRGGEWVAHSTCRADENCDQSSGACKKIAPACQGRAPGARFCAGDVRTECGPDLVSVEEQECDGVCVAKSAVAQCLEPICSDHKVEDGEECDDGNTESGDGCSARCTWEIKAIATGAVHSCALTEGGKVKCWGDDSNGQLGQPKVDASATPESKKDPNAWAARGDQAGEMGTALPFVDLGTGRSAKALFAGGYNTCALLDDDSLKCWGANSFGQLALGDQEPRGDQAGEMGDALRPVDLAIDRVARSVTIASGTLCATLDNGALKCWGDNASGELGLGDKDARGDGPDERIAQLSPIDLGRGRSAEVVGMGVTHGCAILDDGTVKCWGGNEYGQLGVGDKSARGDEWNEMGEQLPVVNLGTSRTARLLAVSTTSFVYMDSLGVGPFSCAVRSDESLACWGWLKHLGLGEQYIGDDPAEMGNALPTLQLGLRRTAKSLAAGSVHLCVLLDDGTVKCWGNNDSGQVGHSSSTSGASPEPVDLGAQGRQVIGLSAGNRHNCALLRDRTVKCWGDNSYGQLGLGDKKSRGLEPAELGDALPGVDLGL